MKIYMILFLLTLSLIFGIVKLIELTQQTERVELTMKQSYVTSSYRNKKFLMEAKMEKTGKIIACYVYFDHYIDDETELKEFPKNSKHHGFYYPYYDVCEFRTTESEEFYETKMNFFESLFAFLFFAFVIALLDFLYVAHQLNVVEKKLRHIRFVEQPNLETIGFVV